jgi:hypothetical protein
MSLAVPKFLKPYMGVEGGVLLRGKMFEKLNANPTFRKYNTALELAPLWKWGLAVVPLVGVVTGKPAVENIDLNTSLSLAGTGAIWAYYSTLITPRATKLLYVSVALFFANGYNIARRVKYNMDQQKLPESTDSVVTTSTVNSVVTKPTVDSVVTTSKVDNVVTTSKVAA